MNFSNKTMDNKFRFTQTGGFKENEYQSQNYSMISDKRITQDELKIMQLQREIESLKKNQKDISQIQQELKKKEQTIKKLQTQNFLEEKHQKMQREKTLEELAILKTKVSTSKKRLQELELCCESNLVDFEQINRICLEKEKKLLESNQRLEKMNINMNELGLKSNNAGKSQLRLEEEKKMMIEKINVLDNELDERLVEFKNLKDETQREEEELRNLEDEKNNCEKEGKMIEENIEDFQNKIDDLEIVNEEKRIELGQLIAEFQRVELNNFAINKNLEMNIKKLKKQEKKFDDLENYNSKIQGKIEEYQIEKENKNLEFLNLKKEIQTKNEFLHNQKQEKQKIKIKINEIKKLAEKTFFELDQFVNLDEKLISIIKESDYQNIIERNEMKNARSFHNKTFINDEKSFRTH